MKGARKSKRFISRNYLYDLVCKLSYQFCDLITRDTPYIYIYVHTRSLPSFLAIVISGQFRFILNVHGLLSHSSETELSNRAWITTNNAILYEIAINIGSNDPADQRDKFGRKLPESLRSERPYCATAAIRSRYIIRLMV